MTSIHIGCKPLPHCASVARLKLPKQTAVAVQRLHFSPASTLLDVPSSCQFRVEKTHPPHVFTDDFPITPILISLPFPSANPTRSRRPTCCAAQSYELEAPRRPGLPGQPLAPDRLPHRSTSASIGVIPPYGLCRCINSNRYATSPTIVFFRSQNNPGFPLIPPSTTPCLHRSPKGPLKSRYQSYCHAP